MRENSREILQRSLFYKGDIILNEGDEGTTAYVIKSGQVEVFSVKDDKEIRIAVLGPGDVLGEISLISDSKRSASARALSDCDLIIMDRENLQLQLSQAAPSVRALVKILSSRVKNTNRRVIQAQTDAPK